MYVLEAIRGLLLVLI